MEQTMNKGGFGFGLNIVNQICKIYNTKINIESQLKKGTTTRIFTFKKKKNLF